MRHAEGVLSARRMLLRGQDHQVGFDQRLSDLPGLALGLFLLQRVDQFNRREEADALSVMLNGLNAKGHASGVLSARRQHAIFLFQDLRSAPHSRPRP